MQELTVLSHDDYTGLRQRLHDAGLDLCYSVQSARPIHMRWTPGRLHEAALRRAIAERCPADPSFRIASVRVTKPGNRLLPARLTVTFHAVGAPQDEALRRYLAAHEVGITWQPDLETAAEAAEATEEHATPATYIQVALVLAVMTALEVSTFYLPVDVRPPVWALLIVLMLLSACKFSIVAQFFMHLRYDHRIYAGCFVGGLVVATGTTFALLALFRDPSHMPMAPALAEARPVVPAVQFPGGHRQHGTPGAASRSAVVPRSGNTGAGKLVFQKFGCGACHAVASLPSARGSVGPRLDGLAERAAERLPGMAGEAYIRQSIEDPGSYVVKGYLKLMPPLRSSMSDAEFADLLAWLKTL
jgi:cytochrome c oxidase subunit 4